MVERAEPGPALVHRTSADDVLVIDLGEVTPIEGLRYLPRQEDKPGRINEFKFYARKDRFVGLRQP